MTTPVEIHLSVVLGKPPKDAARRAATAPKLEPFSLDGIELKEAAYRVLRHPAVADKTFLVSIGDRTVGGLCSRDPVRRALAGAGGRLRGDAAGLRGLRRRGLCHRRAHAARADRRAASGRMAVGEALTNLAAARVGPLDRVKLSANWMAAAGSPGEDAALFDTVRAVALELCPALGVAIPVGKDSLSMRTAWDGKEVVAPLSLIVTAFASIADARATLTPRLRTDAGRNRAAAARPGRGQETGWAARSSRRFIQGSATRRPTLIPLFHSRISLMQFKKLNQQQLLLAYHDRSDGGLFATLCEMAFAGRCGVTVSLDELVFDRWLDDVDGFKRANEEQLAGRLRERALQALFAEGTRRGHPDPRRRPRQGDGSASLLRVGDCSFIVGHLNARDEMAFTAAPSGAEGEAHRSAARWSETSFRMQQLRDNPECAQEEYDRILDATDPGCRSTGFEIEKHAYGKCKPAVAILANRASTARSRWRRPSRARASRRWTCTCPTSSPGARAAGFKGLAVCGGFSYGDVLGGGQGWAKSILFNARARSEFEAFFARATASRSAPATAAR
jgi:phosphoribosylformylglycinamidine synthase